MIRDVTLGQFFPGKSILHKLDARVKILLLIVFIVSIFCSFNFPALALIATTIFAIVLMSGVPLKMYLKSLKVIIIIVLITSFLNLFYGSGEPIYQLGFLKITMDGIYRSIFVTVRIVCLILASSALTFTTSPTDLTDAIESLLKPLKVFHVKVHEIAMMMTIALRFVPTLLEETDKIMAAQKSRGANMDSGNIAQKVKSFIPVLVPLFVSAFRRAIDLAMAMECRCYQGGNGRTRMKVLKIKKSDVFAVIIAVFIVAGVILWDVFLPPVL